MFHAALKDGIISIGKSSHTTASFILKKNKIRREKLIVARNLNHHSTDDNPNKILYFDARKKETKSQPIIFREKHISLVSNSNS